MTYNPPGGAARPREATLVVRLTPEESRALGSKMNAAIAEVKREALEAQKRADLSRALERARAREIRRARYRCYVDGKEHEAPTPAGLVIQRRARQTAGLVSIFEAAAQDLDASTRWVVVCERHGSILDAATRRDADTAAARPLEWCEDCREAHEETP